ncbi:hypothetical protein FCULG_00006367 [Fusarium culmorum]|uniref:Transmembrane protein n=1 Tax=Fusarium culmorum TaxID=5516 RepID=A0A2T4GUP5_FUSCU|nr:hypothetical protein FCULG_00006367 [Fusarium culmorum]
MKETFNGRPRGFGCYKQRIKTKPGGEGGYKRQEFLLGLSILETASTSNHFVYVTYLEYRRIYRYILTGVAFTMLVLALLIARCCYYKRYDFNRAKQIDEELAEIRSGRSGYLPWEIQRSRIDRGDWNMISRYYRRHPELLVDED